MEPTFPNMELYLTRTQVSSKAEEFFDFVIKNGSSLKTLTLHGLYFINNTKMDNFLTKLGESAVSLVINLSKSKVNKYLFDESYMNPSLFLNVFKYFKNIQELTLDLDHHVNYTPGLAEFYEKSEHLEKIVFTKECKNIITETSIHQNFINVIQNCKSLKIIEFSCDIPLEASIISDIFSALNENFWGMEEIIFDCDPLPCWIDYSNFYWIIRRMILEFEINKDTSKLFIKPLEITERMRDNTEINCQQNCNMKHTIFKSDSVIKFARYTYTPFDRCLKYIECCFEGFSFVQKVDIHLVPEEVLNLMVRHLKCLKQCSLSFEDTIRNNSQLPIIFENFVKAFPNLTYLAVCFNHYITTDDCIKHISKHIKTLTHLEFDCLGSKLTSVGLKMLDENSFSKLKYLEFDTAENKSDIAELFNKLPELERIQSNPTCLNRNQHTKGKYLHSNLKKLKNDQFNLHQTIHVDDFPSEILEKIFLFLSKKNQLQCRAVCKRWFDIFSSSPKLDRSLSFQYSYLSRKTNPVRILLSTEFKYNRMVFYKDTYFDDEDLSEFWQKIGVEIKELSFQSTTLKFGAALKTGLKSNHFLKLEKLTLSDYEFYEVFSQNNKEFNNILKRIKSICLNDYVTYFSTYSSKQASVFEMTNLEEFELYLFGTDFILEMLSNCLSFPNLKKLSIFSSPDLKDDPNSSTLKFFKKAFNFDHLTTLLIGNFKTWPNNFLKLICDNLSSLQSLGICMINDGLISKDPIKRKFCNDMFSKLKCLDEIFFISVSEFSKIVKEPKYILYRRTGSLTNELHHTFYKIYMNYFNLSNILYIENEKKPWNRP